MKTKKVESETKNTTKSFTPIYEEKKKISFKEFTYLDNILPTDFKKSYFREVNNKK